MARIEYNKLVRDGIQAKLETKGIPCAMRTAADVDEFVALLREKVGEEARELIATDSRETFLAEYADLVIALDALTGALEVSPAELKLALEANIADKGLFSARQVLLWTEEPDNEVVSPDDQS